MEFFKTIIDIFLHIDKNLASVVANYGAWVYGLMFLIIFMETGFVVTPFLPGDSLLFAAGAMSAIGSLNIWWLYGLLLLAAIGGDTVNYWIGHKIGPVAFEGNIKFLKKEYLHKAEKFYEKHGGKAIVLARFVPIVRTFAPFVAGVSKMNYSHFIAYNVVGGLAWVSLFLWGGYWFGNIPFVKENFHYVVLGIVFVSVVPMAIEVFNAFVDGRRKKKVVE